MDSEKITQQSTVGKLPKEAFIKVRHNNAGCVQEQVSQIGLQNYKSIDKCSESHDVLLPITQSSTVPNPPEFVNQRQAICFHAAINYVQQGYIKYYDGNFYCFNGKYHSIADNNILRGYAMCKLREYGIEPSHNEVSSFVKNVSDRAIELSLLYNSLRPDPPDLWVFNNCRIDINSGIQYEPSPVCFVTGAINANYYHQPIMQCPYFFSLLQRISDNDPTRMNFLLEVIAYLISPEYHLKNIFCFVGVCNSGKSLLLNIIRELLTPELTVNMSVENFTNSRFAISELKGKRICISSDESDFHFGDKTAATLKLISGGGETITADVKNQSQINFLMTAKLVIASNHPIHDSAAKIDPYLKNRMLVVPFLNAIPIEELEQANQLQSIEQFVTIEFLFTS